MSAAPPAGRGYAWAVVAMLWLVCLFNYADRQAVPAIFPALRSEFGFSPVQLGLIGSAFMWVYALGGPLAGYIGDRIGRRPLIVGGCLGWSLVTGATAWCSRLWQFVGVRALVGTGETLYFPASMSLISDYHGRSTRSTALAMHQSSVYAGTIAGAVAGGWMAEHWGWRRGFWVFGAVGIGVALLVHRCLREPRRGAAESAESPEAPAKLGAAEALRLTFRRPAAWLLMAAFLGANFVATIFLTWMPTFLVDRFGFGLTRANLWATVFISVASAAGAPLGGAIADRLARRLPGGRILVQAAGLAGAAAFVGLVATAAGAATLAAAMLCFGFSKGLYDSNIFASLYDSVEPRARGTAAGIMNTVGWTGGALGPLAVGFATEYGRHGLDQAANMADAIGACSWVYGASAALLLYTALKVAGKRSP